MQFSLFDNIGDMPLGNNNANLCASRPEFPKHISLGIAYVPFQQWGEVYDADEAYGNATLFPQLNFPFEGGNKS